jgi:hypothetical protein
VLQFPHSVIPTRGSKIQNQQLIMAKGNNAHKKEVKKPKKEKPKPQPGRRA